MVQIFIATLLSFSAAQATTRVEYLRPCEAGLVGAARVLAMPRTSAELRQALIDFGALNSPEFQTALIHALEKSGLGRESAPTLKAWVKSLAGAKRAAPALATLTLDELAAHAVTPVRRVQLLELADALAASGRRAEVLSIMADGVRESLGRASDVLRARTIDRWLRQGTNVAYTAVAIGLIPLGLKSFDAFYGQDHFFFFVDHNDTYAHFNAAMRTGLGMMVPLLPAALVNEFLRDAHAHLRPVYLPPADGTPSLVDDVGPPALTTLAAADDPAALNPVELTYLGRAELLTIADTVTALRGRWGEINAAWAAARARILVGDDHAASIGDLRDQVVGMAIALRARRAQLKAHVDQVGVARSRLIGFAKPGLRDNAGTTTRRALAAELVEHDLDCIPAREYVVDPGTPALDFDAAIAKLGGALTDLQLATGPRAVHLVDRIEGELAAIEARYFPSGPATSAVPTH